MTPWALAQLLVALASSAKAGSFSLASPLAEASGNSSREDN
jgi:hypothetical protein